MRLFQRNTPRTLHAFTAFEDAGAQHTVCMKCLLHGGRRQLRATPCLCLVCDKQPGRQVGNVSPRYFATQTHQAVAALRLPCDLTRLFTQRLLEPTENAIQQIYGLTPFTTQPFSLPEVAYPALNKQRALFSAMTCKGISRRRIITPQFQLHPAHQRPPTVRYSFFAKITLPLGKP